MSSLLRPANLFILTTYIILSAVPFTPFFLGQAVDRPGQIILTELIAWLTVWVVFKRPIWFHWLLIPAFFALPIELYLHTFYGQGISTHLLGIIAETSPKESLEFLGNKVWILLFITLVLITWWWLSWKATRSSQDLDWTGSSRWIIFFMLTLGFSTWLYGHEFGVLPSRSTPLKNKIASSSSASRTSYFPSLPTWANIPLDINSVGNTWPFGLMARGYDFWKERQYLSELSNKSHQFKFNAYQTNQTNIPQVIVMVIGESSRYDRWSLNGYRRDTNPLLRNEKNLVSFSNLITAVSATRLSVPLLVTRKTATQSLKAGFSEKSFLSAFKEAGFKTYWLSNQMSFGRFDTPVSVYANEADVTQFLNLGGFTNDSNHDQVLLEPFKYALQDPSQKKLIVLHTLGNHWNYSHRYPKEYDKWQPSLFGIKNPAFTNLKIKPQLNNSYDNSILYTDWILSQIIAILKSSQQLSSMIYVSDHGQTLYDGTCNLAFHGHNTQYEFHIPALMWYSDLYQSIYPAKINQMKQHKNARLSTENIFHSLLDMADIRYNSEQLEWSFLSNKFKMHKRYVDSYGWTNYDNAIFKGDCREVIDNNKPLPQEK